MNGDFHLGDRLVQPSLNRIVGPRGAVRVEPRAMRVLCRLARAGGEVVTREQLLEEVWTDVTVGDDSLTGSISMLRRALGDEARHPRFIATVPKTGYRLVTAGRPIAGTPGLEKAARAGRRGPLGRGSHRARRVRRLVAWSAGLAVAFGVAAVLLLSGYGIGARFEAGAGSRGPRPALPPRPRPLAAERAGEFDPAFSPDGTRLAYVWSGTSSDLDIYVRALEADTPMRLTTEPGFDGSPSWSPDGRRIAFMRTSLDGRCGVYLRTLSSGDERRVADCHDQSESSVAFSPQGELVAFADRPAPGAPFRIHLVSLDTLEVRPLTSPPPGYYGDLDPAFSPDGSRVAFVRGALDGTLAEYTSPVVGDLYTIAVAGGPERRITWGPQEIPGLDWSRDGRWLIFASNREGGRYEIWRAPATGGPAAWLLGADGMVRNPVVNRATGELAYEVVRVDTNVWRLPMAGEVEGGQGGVLLLASTYLDQAPAVSPAGDRIAFVSSRSGQTEVWTADPEGGRLLKLTSFEGPTVDQPCFSPDGRWIVFSAWEDDSARIYRVRSGGGPLRRITGEGARATNGPGVGAAGRAVHDLAPSVSADGQWVYFGSDRGGSWQVWRVPADGGAAVQVTREGGFRALESGGGRPGEDRRPREEPGRGDPEREGWLYFVRLDRPGIWRRPLGGDGAAAELVADHPPREWANWTVHAGKLVRFRRTGWGEGVLEELDTAGGGARRLATLSAGDHPDGLLRLEGLTVSPDGRSILLARADDSTADILSVAMRD